MNLTNQAMLVLVLLILISETNTVNCGSRNYETTREFSDESEASLEESHIGKPLNGRRCNNDWSKIYDAEHEGYVPVNCGRCSIYNLKVRAWRNTDFDPKVCWGLTPELFSSSWDCMWKKNCILRYTPSTIVWSPPNESRCIGEEPGTLDVAYSCLDPETPIDDVFKGFQVVESAQGLIRSHNYDSKNRIPYPKYKNKHIMDVSPPADLRISWKDYYVMLYVITSDIGKGDILTVRDPNNLDTTFTSEDSNDKCEIVTWQAGDFHNISTSTLRFEFLLNDSVPGTGFDICFQWFDRENANAKAIFNATVNLCRQVTRDIDDVPTFDIIKDTASQEHKGFIRSHSRYPWNYPRPPINPNLLPHNNDLSEVHVVEAPKGFSHLRLKVQRLDLGRRDKLLLITSEGKTVSDKKLRETRLHEFRGQSVTFNFSISGTKDQTSIGFLLCYQWYTPGQKMPTDLCDQFVYNVHPCKKGGKKELKQRCNLKNPPREKGKTKTGKKGQQQNVKNSSRRRSR